MRNVKIMAVATVTAFLSAQAASAVEMLEHPEFAPGPQHVSAVPHYYDPGHTDHDYSYWQQIHDRELAERNQHAQEVAQRHAQADRLMQQDQIEQQRIAAEQQQHYIPAR